MLQNSKNIISKNWDYLLIIFPIWIPLGYFLLITNFPKFENIFFILVMIFLGETHFGSTWWMYFEKKNMEWAYQNKTYSIYYPLCILIFLITLAIVVSLELSLFLILLFNVFHVTKQSSGIIKVYAKDTDERINSEKISNSLYFISTIIIIYGLLKFVLKIKSIEGYSLHINLFAMAYILISNFYFYFILKFKNIRSLTSYMTGILMWMPLLWVDKIYHAFAMGVGMHYVQYLAITLTIYYRKNNIKEMREKISDNKFLYMFIGYLLIYSLIMVALTNMEFSKNLYLFLIPIFFQTLHFYADMFTWKFSNPYIRENVGKFLYRK